MINLQRVDSEMEKSEAGTILKRKNLKKGKSGKNKSEEGQLLKEEI